MYDSTKPYRKEILKLIRKTWDTPFVSVKDNVIKKKFCLHEFAHSDGIGTKGIYHWRKKTFKNAVLDALAMNLNDMLMMSAQPYAILNHLFLPKDDKKSILETIGYLSKECQKRKIAILGGETAIHNEMKGMELSITMLGFVGKLKENKFRVGDVLIGIKSNGLHSNGFTRVRETFGKTIKPEFVAPTFIYFDEIFPLIKKFDIHGICHITGGAFTKLKDLLNGADAKIIRSSKLNPQKIFKELYKKNISDKEMYKTFNCGIGLVLSVSSKEATRILRQIKDFKADVIGKVVSGNGKVKIQSVFSNKEIIF